MMDGGGEPHGGPALDRQRLRVWLRILKLQRQVGAELRERLRLEYDTTLPQFDVLSALDRTADGLTMSALSEALMVSNGNVTGIVERLVEQGLVERAPVAGDRRATLVRLTGRGRETFAAMAARHRDWVSTALGGLDAQEAGVVIGLLDRARPGEARP
jgi:DNA-binding MarR family transcriptional regulator